MKLLIQKSFIGLLFLFIFASVAEPPPAHASILDDIFNKAKELVSPKAENVKQEVKMNSFIKLTPNGDVDKNNQIDAGDIVRFEYTIINNTKEDLKFAKIDTKIKRSSINYIHNASGTTGLDDDGKTIVIKNIRIPKMMGINISFDARTSYFIESDDEIYTEPEFSSMDGKYSVKNEKITREVKKISKEKYGEQATMKSVSRGSPGKEPDEKE